jgi:hippurate hydrolase
MAELDSILAAARDLQPEVVDLRRRIHQEPELGLELPETRSKILDALEGLPLEIQCHERTSGVVARLTGGRPGPTVLLRGDMDALPMPEDTELPFRSKRDGAMHACGHDSHVAMLAGAAKLLSARKAELPGDVVFMFQPGEEGFGGAKIMLDEGMPDFDSAFALHITPLLPTGKIGTRPGPLLASADFFEASILGKGGHASMPHDCRDPIPVACEIVQALQTFVTREIPATDPVVLTVASIHAGTTSNVIPEKVNLSGTIRSLSERSREKAHEGLHRIFDGVTHAHGLKAEVDLRIGYPVTSNDAGFEAFARGVATDLLGERAVFEFPSPVMGAEDFSYVLNEKPGAMFFLGVRPPGENDPAPCHSNRMMLDEEGMAYGTALHTAVAMRFLESNAG